MGTQHRHQWTWTSDASDESLVSQIASYVERTNGTGACVVASGRLFKALQARLPDVTIVEADHRGIVTGFDVRVTVVAPSATATFELKRVGKIATGIAYGAEPPGVDVPPPVPPPVPPETLTVADMVWAKTNLNTTYGIQVAASDTEFGLLTKAAKAACIKTLSGGTLYNRFVDFAPLCAAGFRIPTKDELSNLLTYYVNQYAGKLDVLKAALERDLGVTFGGYFVINKILPGNETWWNDARTAGLNLREDGSAEVMSLPHELQAVLMSGLSVRLIQG